MSDKIVKSFLNTPLTLLLILLTILIIFCVMKHKLYNLQSIMFDSEDYNEIEYKINNHQSLIKNHIIKLNDIIENSKLKTKENFDGLTQDELNRNLANLQTLKLSLNNFNSTSLDSIQQIMNNVNNKRLIDKNIIISVLTDIYTLRYLENINQKNAVSYHEYNKYTSPETNIYYKQYL